MWVRVATAVPSEGVIQCPVQYFNMSEICVTAIEDVSLNQRRKLYPSANSLHIFMDISPSFDVSVSHKCIVTMLFYPVMKIVCFPGWILIFANYVSSVSYAVILFCDQKAPDATRSPKN